MHIRTSIAGRAPARSRLARLRLLAATLTVALLPVACGGGGDDPAPVATPSEPAALAGITAAHNQLRSTVGAPPLVWSSALAATAQAWADAGTDTQAPLGLLDHNPARSTGYPYAVGENLAASTSPLTGQAAVALWAAEASGYDYASNTCSAASGCSQYTQVVWATSREFGCGVSYRPALAYAYTVVCNYGPAGNTGGRPY